MSESLKSRATWLAQVTAIKSETPSTEQALAGLMDELIIEVREASGPHELVDNWRTVYGYIGAACRADMLRVKRGQ